MRVVVNIFLKNGVLDPAGKATQNALVSLGFDEVEDAKIGKQIVLSLKTQDKNEAQAQVKKMCEELLANTVIEYYEIVL